MAEDNINWQRSYKIIFGTPEFKKDAYDFVGSGVLKVSSYPKIEVDSLTIPSNALVISNLVSEGNSKRGFTFTLDSTRKTATTGNKSTEKTTIQLYNLNKESLDVLNQDGCVMRVFAGYQDRVELAYSGDVEQVSPIQSGMDIVQRVRCVDGSVSLKNTIGTIDYDESVSEKDMILDLANRFPDSSVGFTGLIEQENIFTTGGQSFSGSLDNMFNKVMARNNLNYGRFNGKIVIVPYSLEQASSDFQKLAANTFTFPINSIKNITSVSKNGKKKTAEKKTREGVVVNSFFIPIELGQFFTIPKESSVEYAGTYLVNSVRTVLKSHAQEWDVVITGEPI